MKGKIALVGTVFIAALMIVNAFNMASVEYRAKSNYFGKTSAEFIGTLKPAPVALTAKAKFVPVKYRAMPTDIEVFGGEASDENPSLISDGGSNLLALYETEVESMDYDIGIANSMDGGATWTPYAFTVDGSPSQPRLALYSGEQAYGTWTADPVDGFGYSYIAMFPDIRDPEAGDGWSYAYINWGSHDIGVPFTSADVACYNTPNPPTTAFWGIVAHTGYNDYSGYEEDNTFMFEYETEENYFTIIFFYNMNEDVFNVSSTIDQSNGIFYMAADAINSTDPSKYGTYLLVSPPITSDESWWQGNWPGIMFYNCSHPDIAAFNGKVYIATELKMSDGSTDIVCWVSNSPSSEVSWNMYTVTSTPGENEQYPVISAINENEAAIMYVKDGIVYVTQTKDGGATWSEPIAVNDGNNAVSQYGCLDMAYPYGVWTDNINGNYDIFFDTVALAPALEVNIGGGLGVKATVSNTGTAAAENVPWSIDVSGGIVLLGKHAEGTITSLNPGESATIKDFLIGFGKVTVTVKVGSVTKTASGFLLGPLAIGLK